MKAIDIEKSQREKNGCREASSVVEVPVLLESWLLTDLESAARDRGMSAGAMVRCLLREFLSADQPSRDRRAGRTSAPARRP